jgi:hypothetical protein
MGYYTKYEVTISNIDDPNKVIESVERIGFDNCNLTDDRATLDFYYDGKWYDWQKDCIRLSNEYPKILIEIEAEGEEYGDIWKARIRNGICERVNAKIIYDEFKIIT